MLVELIHNPASGTHDQFRLDMLSHAFQACGAKVRVGTTKHDGRFEIFPESDLVCVSGGDGALRLVVASMVRSGIAKPLCIFPAGTVNLVAKELGYSSDPEIFAREIIKGFLAKDAARLEAPLVTSDDQPFVACISAGPDGQAVARHSPALKKRIGGAAYAFSMIKLLADWPKLSFSLEVEAPDGTKTQIRSSAFYVIKAHHYAGNWTLAPSANIASDICHVISLDRARRRDFVRFLVTVALSGQTCIRAVAASAWSHHSAGRRNLTLGGISGRWRRAGGATSGDQDDRPSDHLLPARQGMIDGV